MIPPQNPIRAIIKTNRMRIFLWSLAAGGFLCIFMCCVLFVVVDAFPEIFANEHKYSICLMLCVYYPLYIFLPLYSKSCTITVTNINMQIILGDGDRAWDIKWTEIESIKTVERKWYQENLWFRIKLNKKPQIDIYKTSLTRGQLDILLKEIKMYIPTDKIKLGRVRSPRATHRKPKNGREL